MKNRKSIRGTELTHAVTVGKTDVNVTKVISKPDDASVDPRCASPNLSPLTKRAEAKLRAQAALPTPKPKNTK